VILELIATFCTALFAGAAIYINLVEHPARLECGTAAAVAEWRPSYRRATIMQASLALMGLLSAVAAWLQGRGAWVLVAGLVLGIVIPFTLLIIFPTNKALEDPALDVDSARAAALLSKWKRLHAVRSVAGLIALIVFFAALGRTLVTLVTPNV